MRWIVSRGPPPSGLSAQNILAVKVIDLRAGATGPAVHGQTALGRHIILARITRRAANQLALGSPGTIRCMRSSNSMSSPAITSPQTPHSPTPL